MNDNIKQRLNEGRSVILHTSIDIDYMLKQYSRGDLDFLSNGDRILSHDEAVKHLQSLKDKGHKVMCCSGDECIGFDPMGGGCPGHVKGEYDEGYIYAVKHLDGKTPTENPLYKEDWSLCFYHNGSFYHTTSPVHKLLRFNEDEVIEAIKVKRDDDWLKFRCYDVLLEEIEAQKQASKLKEAFGDCDDVNVG